MAQTIQAETLEKLTMLDPQQQDQVCTIRRQLQGQQDLNKLPRVSSRDSLIEARTHWKGLYDLRSKLQLSDFWHSKGDSVPKGSSSRSACTGQGVWRDRLSAEHSIGILSRTIKRHDPSSARRSSWGWRENHLFVEELVKGSARHPNVADHDGNTHCLVGIHKSLMDSLGLVVRHMCMMFVHKSLNDPPDIRELHDNIREERWANFSLDSVKFPTLTVDVVKRRGSFGELRIDHSFPEDLQGRTLCAKGVQMALEQPKASEGKNTSQFNKGNGKGKKGKGETKNQQCIPFFRGICKKGDHCNYEHQEDSEGKPLSVDQEFLQRYDDANKRSNEAKAQNIKKDQGSPERRRRSDIRKDHARTGHWCLTNQCATIQGSEDC